MRHSLLFAVATLTTIAQVRSLNIPRDNFVEIGDEFGLTTKQGAAVDKRQNINIDGSGNVNVEGANAGAVEVKTVNLGNAGSLNKGANGGGSGQGNLIAGILDALNGGSRNNQGNRNKPNNACPPAPPAPPPVTVTKTIYQNASVPAPLTVFVTQAPP